MRLRKAVLTEHELEIMQIVWQRPTVTVRDVYEELLKRRKIAYTTVMTMMGILEEKGFLKKSRGEKAYVYRPAQPKSKVVGSMVNDFVSRVFDGSAKPLLVHLVENEHLSQEELDEIARLMKERKRIS
jgi:BlaI family penicillinase repressor